jgi:hypothetical protein
MQTWSSGRITSTIGKTMNEIDWYIVISFIGCIGFWVGVLAHTSVGG